MMYKPKSAHLSDVAEVQVGYTPRGALVAAPVGVPAVQLRDLRGAVQTIDLGGLPSYALGPSFERYWAGPGDILFRSRGERNTAALVEPLSKGAAVAVMPLIILRPNRDVVEPAYLSWYINQAEAQAYFDKCARGTQLRMIPKKCIDELEVVVPDLAAQKQIVEINRLARLEFALSQQLAEKKLALAEFALLQQMRNAQSHGNGTGRIGARHSTASKSERTD
jgi:hypothetical protein